MSNYRLKQFATTCLFISLLFLTNCSDGSTVPDSDDFDDLASDDTKTQIQFNLQTGSKSLIETNTPNEIIYITYRSNNLENPVFHRKAISSTDSTLIDLPKESLSFLGLVYNPTNTLLSSRDISGSISLIGNISIVTMDLNSIPLSDNASSIVDLGELSYNGTSFDSSLPSNSILNGFGIPYDSLISIGNIDATALKVLNPDVDSNNVYDLEEGKRWLIRTRMYFRKQFNQYTDNFTFDASELIPEAKDFSITLSDEFGVIPDSSSLDEVVLTYPSGYNIPDQNPFGYLKEADRWYLFQQEDTESVSYPIDGDYSLAYNNTTLNFNGVKFSRGYDGLSFPFLAMTIGTAGNVTEISWNWKTLRNGVFVNSDEEYLYSTVWNSYFFILFVDNSKNQILFSIDRTPQGNVDISSLNLMPTDIRELNVNCDDFANNRYQFHVMLPVP